jgi:hypothetical protein
VLDASALCAPWVRGRQILRIELTAPGLAGVVCAPRELVVETVLKTDDTGDAGRGGGVAAGVVRRGRGRRVPPS